ncbi:NnrS family protein [Roseinatronobacter sp.]|uniref:NnrS family protein n=1 Tax=Roseinatronobacter sp. TaxID=1945755 RepID=UPI0025E0604C|nr:NnrS family protein [Rhodobaca sp.]
MTTASSSRSWTGPALLSYGFRPFFLLSGIWACFAMVFWLMLLAGLETLPIAFAPTEWHVHSFVFGYLSAVIAGFLLTAVPNWTGRLPVVGWPLAGLVGLWVLGRMATMVGASWPVALFAVADLALPVTLIGFLAREIATGRNWRNLPVLGLVAFFAVANAVFHSEAAQGAAHDGYGLRMGLAAVLMLIALIGGRIVPSFTRNFLVKRQEKRLPVAMNRADGAVLGLTGVALLAFVVMPNTGLTASLCMAAGGANLWRLSRWQGLKTGAEPLVWVLHAAYAMLALGFLAVAAAALDLMPVSAARHVWLAGAIGLMTLAVMTRASLGHAGLPLTAGRPVTALYLALIGATFLRLAAGIWPGALWPLHVSGMLWVVAFGGFSILYWPILTRAKQAPKTASRARPA